MLPDVGAIKRRASRPSVLFPDPDSPTRPRVSPASTSNDTLSTARTSPFGRPPKTDSPSGKTLVRLRISSRGMKGIVTEPGGSATRDEHECAPIALDTEIGDKR